MTDRAPRRQAEPRFDVDLAWGKQAELQFTELLTWVAEGNGRAEVKRKDVVDWYFFLETHCDYGCHGEFQPSGISITTAHVWAIAIEDTGVTLVVPTESLRLMLNDPTSKDKACRRGNNPTRGKLINLVVLLFRWKQHQDRGVRES